MVGDLSPAVLSRRQLSPKLKHLSIDILQAQIQIVNGVVHRKKNLNPDLCNRKIGQFFLSRETEFKICTFRFRGAIDTPSGPFSSNPAELSL